jgi:hypothetical protein
LLIKPRNINDVVNLIKTSLLLAGESTEREEVITGTFVDVVKQIRAKRSSSQSTNEEEDDNGGDNEGL